MFKKRYRGAGTVRWMRSDGHSPYVGPNGNWWEWDDHVGDYVDSGIPARGPIGIQGCIVRVTEWAKGIQYRNDQTLSEEIRYIDVVLTINGPAKFDFYQCREMHISDDTNKPSETSRWWKKLDNTFPLYTPLIISPNAKIDLLTNNAIRLLNSNEVVVSYLSGDGENGIAFAAGVTGFGGVSLDSIDAIYNPLSSQILALRSHLNIAYNYIGSMLEYKYGTAGEITEAEYNAAVTASNNAYNACNTSLTAVLSNSTNAYNQIVVGNYNIGSYITNVTNNNNSVKSNYTTIYNSVYLDDADIKNSLNSTYNAYISNIQDYIDILNGIKNNGVETQETALFHDGCGFLAGGNIKWTKNSNGKWDTAFNGKITSNSDGNRIVIDPVDRSLKFIAGSNTLADISFSSGGYPEMSLKHNDVSVLISAPQGLLINRSANGKFWGSSMSYSGIDLTGPNQNVFIASVNGDTLYIQMGNLRTSAVYQGEVYRQNGYLRIKE